MKKTFVAVHDPVHQLLRKLTRHTPLRVRRVDSYPYPVVEYDVCLENLPEDYFALAAFHGLQGLGRDAVLGGRWHVRPEERLGVASRCHFFDALKLDRRCSRDLRLRLRREGPGLLSADLLAYGVGTLRARNDDSRERVHQSLWRRFGRIQSRHETTFATIRALHWTSAPALEKTGKESYDSTNTLYGDVLGEVQQLWDRRADIRFLDEVARSLNALRVHGEAGAYFHPPLNLPLVLKLHRNAQSLWRRPPSSGRALLRRLDYLMENTIVDDQAVTVHSLRQTVPPTQARTESRRRPPAPPREDRSGYDGWLGA